MKCKNRLGPNLTLPIYFTGDSTLPSDLSICGSTLRDPTLVNPFICWCQALLSLQLIHQGIYSYERTRWNWKMIEFVPTELLDGLIWYFIYRLQILCLSKRDSMEMKDPPIACNKLLNTFFPFPSGKFTHSSKQTIQRPLRRWGALLMSYR